VIKDMIVNLSLTENGSVVGTYAASITAAMEAHLTGVAIIYDPVVPIPVGGYIPADVIETQRVGNETAAESAINSFTAASSRAGTSAEPLTLRASFAKAADRFARMARRFDLAIVGQPEMGKMEWNIGETTLFGSGRPMIAVPYIQKEPFKVDNVMICWDGGRAAARAIGDAIPIIRGSERIEIVMVTNDPGKQYDIEGADIRQHLVRHGLKADVQRIPGGNIEVADALLSYAADSAADFMVMGGFGHSRVREFMLGGVTRSIFQSMTVPVLLSH